MVGLAEHIINANEKEHKVNDPDTYNFDEYGLPIADTIDYIVARIIKIDDITPGGNLHMRDDDHIWSGNQWVAENDKNLYRLSKIDKRLPIWETERIWRRLREVLPVLSKDKIIVADGLIWDKKEAKLKRVDYKPRTTENIVKEGENG